MQCPRCGREVEQLLEGECSHCVAERAALLQVEPVVDAIQCAHCGRLQVLNSWRIMAEDPVTRLYEILRPHITHDPRLGRPNLRLDTRWEDDKNVHVEVHLDAELHGVPVERHAETRVRFKTGACGECSREMGGYFEAVLQVRGSPGTDLERLTTRIDEDLIGRMTTFKRQERPGAFFSKVESTRNGKDYYVGSHELARILAEHLANTYGAERDESAKLVGRKDGRDLYRATLLVRLPPYAVGDFVEVEETPYKLLSFDRRNLLLLDLERHERVRRELNRVGPIRIIGRASDEQDAIVVSRSGGFVQVMDPATYKTVDLAADDIPHDAASVRIFRWDGDLYPVFEKSQTRQ